MSEPSIPPRSAIAKQYTWNAESVFASAEDWQAEMKSIAADVEALAPHRQTMMAEASQLVAAFAAVESLMRRIDKATVYAMFSYTVDTTNQVAAGMSSQARGLQSGVAAAASFLNPQLLAIGEDTLAAWMAESPELALYAHFIEDLFRKQAHVRSPEVEELLGMVGDTFGSIGNTVSMLTDADFKFRPAVGLDGAELPVTQGTYETLRTSGDREARRTAWESFYDQHLAYKNTLASNLEASIKANVFQMRARRHDSTLGASLFDNNIPVSVFHNLIDTFKANLPTWHRYWRVRRQALGVETLHPYDIWAPLTASPAAVSYEQAVDWICAGLAPLGEEYVETVRRGCLEERWIDVYPNEGKTQGAFSWGTPDTYPFILTSFDDNVFALSTLAHELGHSMHSLLTWQTQPYIYSDYSLFVAEVASNFHQALVRAHLLETNNDPAFQINVIEEAMSNFHRYFLIMPTLARFELEMHERVERGEGLTADSMIARMAELFGEAYGDEMHVDQERVGIVWATFGHLYADYYVYQYATGISGANALANRVLRQGAPAAEAYLSFLKRGSALYPLDALQLAGVDLTSPAPVQEAFAVLAGLVDRLEELVG